ncbi:unnamed protein product [Lactuca saligna]|uniref:Uncharacterized protein n=1 Tax=Lactuca saligna TaxID=75948 RepID=A0AA35VCC6_LACSI|nr:unnamed protein product [Lactuca saligna]
MATHLHLTHSHLSFMATHLHLTHSHFLLPYYKLLLTAAPEPRLCQFGVRHCRCLLVTDCASSLNETRVTSRKPMRTYVDLCNDLREFMSDVGFPNAHVPSLKELSHHGRQVLANLVRRRGYKLIKELLAASQEINHENEKFLLEILTCTFPNDASSGDSHVNHL